MYVRRAFQITGDGQEIGAGFPSLLFASSYRNLDDLIKSSVFNATVLDLKSGQDLFSVLTKSVNPSP
jgi:hypothetical protein